MVENRLRVVGLLLFAAIEFSGIWVPVEPSPVVTGTCSLGVPLIAQRGHYLCWAACTEMVMKYYRYKVDPQVPVIEQCALSKLWYIARIQNGTMSDSAQRVALADTSKLQCPTRVILQEFDLAGYPFLDNFAPNHLGYELDKPDSLSVSDLQSSFARHEPVIFQWIATTIINSGASASHDMVAEGCSTTRSAPNSQWVSVNDPWPIDSTEIGRHAQMAYTDFRNSSHSVTRINTQFAWDSHGQDYIVKAK